ncbi:MAG TPA: cytochrome c [Candidatus Binataceae bacterium]|nr:cytochrome c [Candidatus Binataceae bacterium]
MRRLPLVIMLGISSQLTIAHAANEPPPFDPDLVKDGHALYGQYCASCHGANAEGAPNWQQRDQQGELPAPPHNAEGHTWRHSDAELYQMVSKGLRDPFNKTTRLTMPPFGDVLSHDQIVAVVTYLKTLWTADERQFQAEESQGHPFPRSGQ